MNEQAELTAIVERLYPLNLISAEYLPQLLTKILRVSHDANKTLIKSQPTPSKLYHYILGGSIDLRFSMLDRKPMKYSKQEAWCQNPLEDLIEGKTGSIRSTSPGEMMVLSVDYVDELLASSQTASLDVLHVESYGEMDNDLIDDEFEKEWSEVFLQTPLAGHLGAMKLHELFSRLEDREVKAGELVVKENTPGNSFFLIKSGIAEVSSGATGLLKEPIELWAGDYFGDESLVAHTTRNANVRMLKDGVLGCLDEEAFDEVLRPALIKTLSEKEAMEEGAEDIRWVDVRLPQEFKHGHRELCVNYPISSLRQRLESLDPAYRYLICPEGGRRSELATYLMRQTGLDAYLCASG